MTTVTTTATAISAGAVAPPATGGARATRSPAHRVEGRAKVTGAARYAAEYPAEDLVHAWPVVATIAAGRVTDVDTAAGRSLVDSMVNEVVVKDDRIRDVVPIRLRTFEEAVGEALEERFSLLASYTWN